ncbi:MAG TPA: phosphotransferase [Acidimicrobiales bacterium]|jgi:hypothetical protein|nr:phosphotransferase [Acidimicrobiales bacterium]
MADVVPPRHLSDFTPEWLSSVLEARISDVRLTEIAVGEGFTGKLARLDLTYADDVGTSLPSSVIGKLPSDEPGAVMLGQLLRLWEREARFYNDVAPTLPCRTARCFYADGYPDEGLWSLVLEDLSFARVGDQVAGTSVEDARRAIEWLVPFHAAWWGRESEVFDWLPRVKTDPTYEALQPMLEGVFPKFMVDLAAELPAPAVAWVERAIPTFKERLHEEPFPSTIYHSDYRLDNMFFESAGGVIPIDWQALAVGQGMYDVAYFIANCVPTDQRRETERDLVERWRSGLEANGIAMPSAADTFEEYRKMVLLVMLVGALLFGQLDFTVNARAGDLAKICAKRTFEAGVDLGVGEFVA